MQLCLLRLKPHFVIRNFAFNCSIQSSPCRNSLPETHPHRQCFLPRGGVIPFSPSLSLSLLLSLSPPLSTSLPQRQSTIRRFLRLWFLSFSRVRVPGPCVCLDHFFSLDGGSWKSRNFPEQRLHTSSRSFFTFYNSFPLFFISHLPPLLSPPSPVPPLSSLFHRGSSVSNDPLLTSAML